MRSISAIEYDADVGGDVVDARLVAEVDAAGQFAHDQQVGAGDALFAQRAAAVERGNRLDRAQVGEQVEALANAQQALLGARVVGVGAVPLRAADGGEQHCVAAP